MNTECARPRSTATRSFDRATAALTGWAKLAVGTDDEQTVSRSGTHFHRTASARAPDRGAPGRDDQQGRSAPRPDHPPAYARPRRRARSRGDGGRGVAVAMRDMEQRRPRFACRSFAMNGALCGSLGTGVVAAGMDEWE